LKNGREKAQSSNSILFVSNLICFIVSILFYFGFDELHELVYFITENMIQGI